nr:MAG: ORF1 [Torque teno virus]
MAYGWWRRRRGRWRRRPWRRRWRTRRRRRRRPRRAFRRRRRVRRRRGRWRRAVRRWRRRGRRRRHKKKLVLRQWQPAFIRKCFIIGYMPLIYCGENVFSKDYASHSDDIQCRDPYGGGMTVTKFNLRILYDEFQRGLNFWTGSNVDLDLARFLGWTLTIFRHPEVDFIVTVRTSPPFKDTDFTAAFTHPGVLMMQKKKILVPSLKSRPSRKHTIRIRIGAPKLFDDRWYPQVDLCDVTLAVVTATAADFQYPFGSPLTANFCVNFQVLGSAYNGLLSNLPEKLKANTSNIKQNIYEKLQFYNTKQTEAQLTMFLSDNHKFKSSNGSTALTIQSAQNIQFPLNKNSPAHRDTLYGGSPYTHNIFQAAENARKAYTEAAKKIITPWVFGNEQDNHLEYHAGMYSSIFLGPGRSNWEQKGPYTDICYNPYMDKGKGNHVWLDWISKNDSNLEEKRAKVHIADIPLWQALFGYTEYAKKVTGDESLEDNARLTLICPYCKPMLYNWQNPLQGFIPYGRNFGLGRMPNGDTVPPIRLRVAWYPSLRHQQQVIEAITQSGPFSYHCDYKSATLNVKYKFKWLWGGNPISHQIVRNPCKDGQGYPPGRKPRSIQVTDPKYNAPEYTLHSWDYRRGFYGEAVIKRMLQQPTPNELYPSAPKRPKKETEPDLQGEEPENVSDFQRLRIHLEQQPWLDSSQEVQALQNQQKEQEQANSLQERLQQQQLLGFQLRCLAYQLQRCQEGAQINPLLLSHA